MHSMRATLRPALPARPAAAAGGAAKRSPAARGAVRAQANGDDEEKLSPLMMPKLQQGVAAALAGLFMTAVAAPVDAAALSGSAYSKVSRNSFGKKKRQRRELRKRKR